MIQNYSHHGGRFIAGVPTVANKQNVFEPKNYLADHYFHKRIACERKEQKNMCSKFCLFIICSVKTVFSVVPLTESDTMDFPANLISLTFKSQFCIQNITNAISYILNIRVHIMFYTQEN